jgi:chemotaxis protein CheD
VLSTVLGSCVAACLWDPGVAMGGMNHFMLPDGQTEGDAPSARYGMFAMEVLINDLVKNGAVRARLRAKVFGGGCVLKQVTSINVGEKNAEFVLRFLKLERIPVVGQDLEGVWARKVNFFPSEGRVLVKRMDPSREVSLIRSETEYRRDLKKRPVAGGIELF